MSKLRLKDAGGFAGVYKIFIGAITFAIVAILFLMSIYGTTHMGSDWREQVFLLKDSVFVNFVLLFLFAGLLFGLSKSEKVNLCIKRINDSEKLYIRVKYGAVTLASLLALGFVLDNHIIPEQDQFFVMNAATNINAGYYDDLKQGGYIAMYPNQVGLLLLELPITKLFGIRSFVVFEIINVFAYAAILLNLTAITDYFDFSNFRKLETLAISIVFVPLFFYTTFIYGNLLGLALSLAAYRLELKAVHSEGKAWGAMAGSAVLIVLASMVKNNYLIFLIALVIHALVEIIRQKNIKIAVLPVLVALLFVLQSATVNSTIEKNIPGADLHNGVSTFAFIAMGLQENSEKCDGWYNDYNRSSYVESGYDSALQGDTAKADIKNSVTRLKNDKTEAVKFFYRKTTSQWNEPTFQSIWINRVRQTSNERSALSRAIISEKSEKVFSKCLELFEMALLAGVLAFFVLAFRKKYFFDTLLLQVTLIGGFLFHMFWEAKCQYTLPYFALLLPLAAAGFGEVARMVRKGDKEYE